MRISLRELMIVVAVAALGLASLRFASSGMRPLLQFATGVVLLGCLLRLIFERGQRQARAAGFLVCAVLYAVAAHQADHIFWKESTAGDDIRRYGDSSFPPTRWLLALNESATGFAWFNGTTNERISFDPSAPIPVDGSQPTEYLGDDAVAKQISDIKSLADRWTGLRPRGGSANFAESQRASRQNQIASEMGTWLPYSGSFGTSAANRVILRAMKDGVLYKYRPLSPQRDTVMAGHCLWMLALGYLGGQFAACVYGSRGKGQGPEKGTWSMDRISQNSATLFSRRGWALTIFSAVLVGMAALRFAYFKVVPDIVEVGMGLVWMALSVLAIIDRGRRQAFAIGFVVCNLVLFLRGLWGVPYFVEQFGAGVVTGQLQSIIPTKQWIDTTTNTIYNYDPTAKAAESAKTGENNPTKDAGNGNPAGPASATTPASLATIRPFPGPESFRVTGSLWKLLVGLAGGTYAIILYERRSRQTTN